MNKETTVEIANEEFQRLKLDRKDVFVSDQPPVFTRLGSHLYGLFVVHNTEILEAQRDGRTTKERLSQMKKETEERLNDIEEIWKRKIPRHQLVTTYLEEQFNAIMKESSILCSRKNSLF